MPLSRASRRSILAASSAASLTLTINCGAFAQTSSTWALDVGTVGGNWSNTADWAGGVAPDNGGVAYFQTLPTFTTAPLSIFVDAPTFTLSRMQFESFITNQFRRPTGNTTNSLTLTGPAIIDVQSPTINSLSSSAFGQLFTIGITGNAGLTKTGPGTMTLMQNAGTFTGDVNVNGGVLCLRIIGDTALGNLANNVNLNNGTLRVNSTAWTTARNINITNNGTLEAFAIAISTTGNITGSGTLNKQGSSTLTMSSDTGLTGAFNDWAGTVTLNSNGALKHTSAIAIRNWLNLDNSGTNLADRINDSAPLTLYGSPISMIGNAGATSRENLNSTTFSRGQSSVIVKAGAGQTASISLGGVTRDTHGVAFFAGDNLGQAPAAGTTNVLFSAAPAMTGGNGLAGSTNINIIPWAFGATSSAALSTATTNSFVTYDANGIRPLNTTSEYVAAISPGVATDNVRLAATGAVASSSTINSLLIAGGSGVTGGGPLTITSGAVLSLAANASIAPAVTFTNEGIINAQGNLTFTGAISGSNGLTKQGAGIATFSNNSSDYTGVTTLGAGSANFTANVGSGVNSAFGNSTSAIQISPAGLGTGGTTARLVYAGTGTGTFARDINVSGRIAQSNAATVPGIGALAGSAIDFNGNISLDSSPLSFVGGAGTQVTVNGNISGDGLISDASGAATIALKGNNNFTGGAELSNSTWQIGSDTAFGSGQFLKLVQTSGGPTLMAIGGPHTISNEAVDAALLSLTYWTIGGSNDLTFTGSINLSGTFNHVVTNTALTTYAGVLHTGGLNKMGAGTLAISGNNLFTGNVTVSAGALRAMSSTALGSSAGSTSVTSGAQLEMSNNVITSEPVFINGTGLASDNLGAIRNKSGNNSLGAITLTTSSTIGVDAGSLKVGNVGSLSGTPDFTKVGAGALTADRYRVNNFLINVGTAGVSTGHSAAKLSTIAGLTIPGGATPTATLDLGDNDLLATNFSVANATSLIAYARDNKLWDRPGITSSVARGEYPHIHTLGTMSGADYNGINASPFDGVTPNATDTLIKFALYGDTDFNDTINDTDFGRLDNGFTNNLTGWMNGDFNLDGMVNVVDYALIDIASTYLDGSLVRAGHYLDGTDTSETGMGSHADQLVEQHLGEFGQPYINAFLDQLPEPTSIISIAVMTGAMTMRRRRR